MGLVLVTFSRDWADEFQAEGFDIMTDEDWQKLKTRLERKIDWYFGTNEGFHDEVISDSLTATPISDEDAEAVYRHFPSLKREPRSFEYNGEIHHYMDGSSFGIFPHHDIGFGDEEEDE